VKEEGTLPVNKNKPFTCGARTARNIGAKKSARIKQETKKGCKDIGHSGILFGAFVRGQLQLRRGRGLPGERFQADKDQACGIQRGQATKRKQNRKTPGTKLKKIPSLSWEAAVVSEKLEK